MGPIPVPLDAGIIQRRHRLHFHGFEMMEKKGKKGSASLLNLFRRQSALHHHDVALTAQLVWKMSFAGHETLF